MPNARGDSINIPLIHGEQVLLEDREGYQISYIRLGRFVIHQYQSSRRVQTCNSQSAAEELLGRLILLNQKSGWKLVSRHAIDSTTIKPPSRLEALGFQGTIQSEHGKVVVCLESEERSKLPLAVAKGIAAEIASERPHSLHVHCAPPCQGLDLGKAFRDSEFPELRSFIFDRSNETPCDQSRNSFGALHEILQACPNLQRCFVTGKIELSAVRHSCLKQLYLVGDPLSRNVLDALAKSSLAGLETLGLHLSSGSTRKNTQLIAQTLLSLEAHNLKHVLIAGLKGIEEFLSLLLREGRTLPWEQLTLCDTAGDEPEHEAILRLIAAAPAAFLNLKRLNVPLGLHPASSAPIANLQIVDALDDTGAFLPHTYGEW